MTSSTELNNWSFSNEVGQYQYYIHGDGPVTDYVNLGTTYKNPADKSSNKGVKITSDQTSVWHGQNMLRTELIPQTSAAINKGKVYYHFSMQHTGVNPPLANHEHQVCFFESHFTEMKFGASGGDSALRWEVNGQSKWDTNFTAGVWHNIAYAIDFDKQTVGFWHSTGGDALTLAAGPFAVSTNSNGADWHLGFLRLNTTAAATYTAAEDWYFSGVYIENGDLTTAVSGPGGAAGSAPVSSSAATKASLISTANAAVAPSLSGYAAVSSVVSSSTANAVVASSLSGYAAGSSEVVAISSSTTTTHASMEIPNTTASLSSSASTLITLVASSSSSNLVSPVASSSALPPSSVSRYSAPTPSAPFSLPAITDAPILTLLSAFVPSAATTAFATNEASASSALAAAESQGACAIEYVYV